MLDPPAALTALPFAPRGTRQQVAEARARANEVQTIRMLTQGEPPPHAEGSHGGAAADAAASQGRPCWSEDEEELVARSATAAEEGAAALRDAWLQVAHLKHAEAAAAASGNGGSPSSRGDHGAPFDEMQEQEQEMEPECAEDRREDAGGVAEQPAASHCPIFVVQVPEGVREGDVLHVTTEERLLKVTVPQGVLPGQMFSIRIPPDPPPPIPQRIDRLRHFPVFCRSPQVCRRVRKRGLLLVGCLVGSAVARAASHPESLPGGGAA